MRTVYVIPGYGGSELFTDAGLTQRLWVDYSKLAIGSVGGLRLAADGVSPGPPDGVTLYAGGPLPDYYDGAIAGLAAAMAPYNYEVIPNGYDWRLSSVTTGGQLADRIRREVVASDPCTLVAHSFGGIVARLAWASLVATGAQGLIRRIITIGSPHWGSYGIVRLWSGDQESTRQLYALSLVSGAFYGPIQAILLGRIWTPERLAALANTWPSTYELLPSLLAPDVEADPLRLALYTGQWPSAIAVSPGRLSAARTVFQPLLAGSSTLPPLSVLTTVAGIGYPTVDTLIAAQPLGSPSIYVYHDTGDGEVTWPSALLAESVQYELTGAHGDLPVITAGLRESVQAILDERGSTPPPPPTVQIPGFNPLYLHGPPFARLTAPGVDP